MSFISIFEIVYILDFGVNSILFQRGIYPAETFNPVQQYGLTILMSKDDKIKEFLKNVLGQAEGEDSFDLFENNSNKYFFSQNG